VRVSTLSEAAAEEQMLAFLAGCVPARASPMCGNSICQDRRFLARWMPRLEARHYRNLDVSTLELARRCNGPRARGGEQGKHEALADVYESIEENKYYREHFLRLSPGS
jgi:oligoribonuclease